MNSPEIAPDLGFKDGDSINVKLAKADLKRIADRRDALDEFNNIYILFALSIGIHVLTVGAMIVLYLMIGK